jgi:hypothetical protein
MKLTDLLSQKKTLILERWLHLLLDSYPPETSGFFKKEKDRFNNPLAFRLSQGLQGVYEALLKDTARDRILASLDDIVSIKALQGFSPSQAVAFIFLLKQVIREELADELKDAQLTQECLEIESRIDGLALLCFEVYMKRREKLYELRINEVKNQVSGLMRRTGLTLITPNQ